MYFIILFVLLFSQSLFAVNAVIIPCQKNAQCPSTTHFCSSQQHLCILKRSLNSTCQHDDECLSDKCYDQLCRRSCKEDKDCHQMKEYCSITNYCKLKHCGACLRDAHCANNHCELFHCASNNCTTILNLLQKHQ